MAAAGLKTNVRSYALCYRAVAAAARAPLARMQTVREQLSELVESQVSDGVLHNSFSYNALLHACDATGQPELMRAMFQHPPEEVAPDAASYSHIIQPLLAQQRVAEVFELRREMEAQGVQPDLVIYNQLIAACAPGHDVEFAFSLMDELQAAGFTPDMYTYHNLLKVRMDMHASSLRSFRRSSCCVRIARRLGGER
jgi:pentatricopeptide repeat protein